MQFALDNEGKRVYAEGAEREISYVCPLCGEPVILRRGEIKVAHFAHKSGHECCDGWHYDMSEWHLRMQMYFDEQYREVVVEKDGVRHRADILMNGVVIEFQHSSLSAEEFRDRNDFYLSCGYKVVWVIDIYDKYEMSQAEITNEDTNKLFMRWKYPRAYLRYAPCPSVKTLDVTIFLYWLGWMGGYEEEGYENVSRVEWSTKDEYGRPDFKRIMFSETEITLEKGMDARLFTMTRHDFVMKEINKYGTVYTVKKIGGKGRGYSREMYVCPKTGRFGLEFNGCAYCPGCAAIEKVFKKEWNIYCCYPKEIRERTGNAQDPNGCPRVFELE